MFKKVVKIMFRKCVVTVKFLGSRKSRVVLVSVLLYLLLLWVSTRHFVGLVTRTLLPPPPLYQNLDHYRRNRSLSHYIQDIQLLIEPSSAPCSNLEEVPLIVLVTSSPAHAEHRHAIRDTWGPHQPTYFLLGLHRDDPEEMLADNYIEAKQYHDLVVYDFIDHYQNLTLKTALMLQWSLLRCPQAQFLMKTDDDVLVNPWVMKNVLNENADANLLGYKNTASLHRDEYNKWYMPRWMYHEDFIPGYLCGPGYIISGEYLSKILKTSHKVPLVNLEDVYFTYIIANQALGLGLTHDKRLSPYKPWLPLSCVYGTLALSHSYSPDEMRKAWWKIQYVGRENENSYCRYFSFLFECIDIWLY